LLPASLLESFPSPPVNSVAPSPQVLDHTASRHDESHTDGTADALKCATMADVQVVETDDGKYHWVIAVDAGIYSCIVMLSPSAGDDNMDITADGDAPTDHDAAHITATEETTLDSDGVSDDIKTHSSAKRQTSAWWHNPKQAVLHRRMGISADLPRAEQERQSRLMRGKVKMICAGMQITLRETWTDYRAEPGLVDRMISSMFCRSTLLPC
jgi:hypothetical protein